ncbi:hypothetical protein HMPREF3218_0200506 [Prevotella bivia]|jgi:hypothetical protein|nr:hypothetical protein HMPREF3218_0200506 [Prevotella bivia]
MATHFSDSVFEYCILLKWVIYNFFYFVSGASFAISSLLIEYDLVNAKIHK